MAERDRMFTQAPEDDVHRARIRLARQRPGEAQEMLDTMPNVYLEVARHPLRARPPAACGARVLREVPGPRAVRQGQLPARRVSRTTGATFETGDEYFDYYRDYHAFWKLYGMALPDAVLKKLYYENALALVPGLPQARFPGLRHGWRARRRWLADSTDHGAVYSSPAAPGSSGRIWPKNCCAAATVRVADNFSTGKREQPRRRRASPAAPSSSSKATSPTSTSPRRAVAGVDYRAAPGGDPVGAAVGEGSDHARTAPTSTPR